MGCIAAAIHDQEADHPAAIRDALDLIEILLGGRTRYKTRSVIMANQLAYTTQQKYAREIPLQRRNLSVHVDRGENAKKAENRRIEERAKQRFAKRARRPWYLNEPFSGSLSSKNKNDLENIALALRISFPENALKAGIRKAIQYHFEAHPELKEDPQFSGLFRRSKRSVQDPTPSEASGSSNNQLSRYAILL